MKDNLFNDLIKFSAIRSITVTVTEFPATFLA